MPNGELCWLSATELARLIATRAVSPVEVVDSFLHRTARLNPQVNAFLTTCEEEARSAAREREAELARGVCRGALHGVPVAIKDIVFTRGVRTTMGARLYADFVPHYDAAVVERLRAAGAIVIAKAHTHEFALGGTTNSLHYGPCRNPYDLARIPGGSSGGSAAAVAAGMCPIAIGTDTAGSLRIPGACCGVVGLKPTYGLVSRYGVYPLSWSCDHVGPLARTVEDAALVLGAIGGYDARDRTSSRAAVSDYAASLTGDLRGVRVGVLREHQEEPTDAEVRVLVDRAIQRLADLGASVGEVSIPSVTRSRIIQATLGAADAAFVHEPLLREHADEYAAEVRQAILLGFGLRAVDYVRAQQGRTAIIADVRAAMASWHVLVGPTLPAQAPLIGQETIALDGRVYALATALAAFTRLHNLTGCPAVTVPCGCTSDGLPVGLQIAGRPFGEGALLRVAAAYERSTTTELRRPRLD